MNQTYFEAGKITGASLRVFLFTSFLSVVFLISSSIEEMKIPFFSLSLSYEYAVSVMLFIDSCMFYRFIAAVNYERELKDRILSENGNCIEKTWLSAYPNIWNFHQFSPKTMSRNDLKTIQSMSIFPLVLFAFIVPLWALIRAIYLEFSIPAISVLALAFTMFTTTYIGLMRSQQKDNNQSKADA